MTQGENLAATTAEDFSDVFARDSHDRGADPVAPDAQQPRDEAGRFAPKVEAAPQPRPEAPPAPEATPQNASPPPQDPDANRHVPLRELKSERTKRQEAEARMKQYEAEAQALRDVLTRQAQYQQPAQQSPQEAALPDPFADPEGYRAAVIEQARLEQRHHIANFSEAQARTAHGDQLVMEATKWAADTGRARHYFFKAGDPYGEMIRDFKRAQALQEIGPDPTAYRKKLEVEIRQQVLAELKQGRTQPPQKFPGSLSSETPTGTQGAHLNPEDAFKELFDTNRNRRAY